jgi:hypothetical protein
MSAVYRVRQGLRALFAWVYPLDADSAQTWLSAAELALFARLQRGEQIHSLKVLADILSGAGTPPRALAAAALLHDVGKIRYPLRVWQKTLVVLTRAALPRLYGRLAAGDPGHWLARPFVVYAQHPTWSAEYAAAAGSDPDTIWLCAHHADPAERWREHRLYPLLVRLQQADDSN